MRRRSLRLLVCLSMAGALATCGDSTSDLIERVPEADASTGDVGSVPECSVDGECSGGRVCSASGKCVECRDNAHCPSNDAPLCEAQSGRCVECLSDAHCDDVVERCSTVLGRCKAPCADGAACPAEDPFCDSAIGFCVACLSNADCTGALPFCRNSECTL